MKRYAYLFFVVVMTMLSSCSSSENMSEGETSREMTIVVSNYMQTTLKETTTRSTVAPIPHLAMSVSNHDATESSDFEVHSNDQEDYNVFSAIISPERSDVTIVGYGDVELQKLSAHTFTFADGNVTDVFVASRQISDKDLSAGSLNVTTHRVVAAVDFLFPEEMFGSIASVRLQSGCGAFNVDADQALESYPREYDKFDLTNVTRLMVYSFLPVPVGQQCQLPMTLTAYDVGGQVLLQWKLSPRLCTSCITRVKLQYDGTSTDDVETGGDDGDKEEEDDGEDDDPEDIEETFMYYIDHLKRLVIPITNKGVQGILGD